LQLQPPPECDNRENHVDRSLTVSKRLPDWSVGKAGINNRAAAFASSSTTTTVGT